MIISWWVTSLPHDCCPGWPAVDLMQQMMIQQQNQDIWELKESLDKNEVHMLLSEHEEQMETSHFHWQQWRCRILDVVMEEMWTTRLRLQQMLAGKDYIWDTLKASCIKSQIACTVVIGKNEKFMMFLNKRAGRLYPPKFLCMVHNASGCVEIAIAFFIMLVHI